MDLINEVANLEQQLKIKRAQLQAMQASCDHNWKVTYNPNIVKSYWNPGDPPGTNGIDRQLPICVPETVTKQWKRECNLCNKTEWTHKTKAVKKAGQISGTTCIEEVPSFNHVRS